ncbi:MAG: long-chain acyl-CoA synthetase [Flavobacterium sp.]|jgi:long-chain acyl-CoA synthetase
MSYFLELDKVNPNQIAAIDDQESQISYGELLEFSTKLEKIIKTRSIVFHFSENSVASLSYYAACMQIKAVPLLLSPQTDIGLIKDLVEKYQPNYVVAPQRICHYFQGEVLNESGDYKLIKLNDEIHQLHDHLSLLLPTSGSTGSPKLVRHSYENLESSAKSVSEFFDLNKSDKSFAFLPMYYTMGLSVINSHLRVGATIILIKSAMTDANFWSILKTSKPTNITGVPYSFEILKKLRFFRMKLPSLKFITQGGGKLSVELYEDCINFASSNNIKFFPTYGQTEGTARLAYLDSSMTAIKKGSIGKAIPSGILSIINEDGLESYEGEASGEMIYRGPNVTLGYANNLQDLKLQDERNGVLYTGDIVRRDADGYYFITGRKSSFLKLYGIRVALDEIEKMVTTDLDIECACGGNDQKMIVLITKPNMNKHVADFIVKKTGLFHQSFVVEYVEEIPRNETGKVTFYGRF